MMVTFVSQCEKKSLNRTRRVLDVFANRIGNRTWQTVITNEGLQAVKKLLRKTASKNTAVSCHWMRSRSRSELVWVVGNRGKFDARGVVPVNFTNQSDVLKVDEIKMNIDHIYANTKQQPLDQHLFAVGYVAQQIIEQLMPTDKNLSRAVYTAGALHDIGKIDPEFQKWLVGKLKKKEILDVPEEGQHIDKSGKFSFEKHPRHNEISLLIFHLLHKEKNVNQESLERIKHAIYWHHAKPIRKAEFKNLDTVYNKFKNNIGDTQLTEVFHTVPVLVKKLNEISENYFSQEPLLIERPATEPEENALYQLQDSMLPKYKRYSLKEKLCDYQKNIRENAKNNLARTAVISADRLISELDRESLSKCINEKKLCSLLDKVSLQKKGLKSQINECLEGFEQRYPESGRNTHQSAAAKKLLDVEHIAVLNGPAGCGKTKIALEWAKLSEAKKIIWICPRVQICQGLISDLTSNEYLPNSKIEILTSEFKSIYQFGNTPVDTPEGEEFSGDIVLTTIDQVINVITTHTKVTGLVQYMNAHVVFDEYHEYINMAAFNLLFSELVECKKLRGGNAKTLLVSATPNYSFIKELLDIDIEDVIGIDSFNNSKYNIQFTNFEEKKVDESNPLYQAQPKNTFVISNTAITAQKSFIENQTHENTVLIHSKYKKSDKKEIFENVFECFKQNGIKNYDVLRAGPIVQASLNISCDRMITEFTGPENWLQRLGRLDRFGLNQEDNIYITVIPTSIAESGKQKGACASFLNKLNSFQSAKAWHEFLSSRLIDRTLSLTQIYHYYQDFYQDKKSLLAVEQDLIDALKKSVLVIENKLLDPISMPQRKKMVDTKVKIKKHSLRGDNRFVQMGICKITQKNSLDFLNQYAYTEGELNANLTASVELICGYGDSKQDLLSFMVKKHHNIKDVKKSYKDSIILNEARNPDTPIYLSYIPQDLAKIGGVAHPHAIYYAIGLNQPIGAISNDKLTTEGK